MQDCDVGTPSLCQRGADYIRAKRANILAKYSSYAVKTAEIIGRNTEIIWLIEPDFWQYYGDTNQQNGGLSGLYMRQLFDDIAIAIKTELPNALISWDISAWLSEANMQTWYGYFATSPHVNFIHTSGGQSKAYLDNIKPNELKWAFMNTLTGGKKIIADTGYGIGGGSTGHNSDWDDVNNLKARIKNGVIAVTQANPRSDWGPTLSNLRSTLPKVC